MQALIDFFGVKDFIPHGYCLAWNPALLWTTVLSNATIVLAYASYPIAIAYFVWKRKDLQYRWLYLSFFNGFILTCATTHLFKVVTVWLPLYWLSAYIDALAAAVAVATVFAIWRVIPQALNLPSPAELRVQRNAAQYARSLIEASLDPLVTISPEGKITDVNEATIKATGVARETLIGNDFSEYFTEPDKARAGYQEVFAKGFVRDYPLTLRHVSGKVMEVLYNTSVYRNDKGEVAGMFAAARDITERKQVEEERLSAGAALQKAIFNSANFSSIATDAKGVIQIFNVGAERMLGYMAADVMNKITPAEISDPQEVIARAKALSVELETPIAPGFEALVFKASRGIEDIYELTYIRKDGSRFPAVVSVTALRDAQNTIIGYLLIGTDNTARKLIEDRLRWTEESFRLMVDSVTDYAIVMLDLEGRIVSWNKGAQRIKGYSTEEIVGQHFSRFYSSVDIERGKPQQDLNSVIAKGRFEDEGCWRVRKDGSTFLANVVFTAIRDEGGNLRGFTKLIQDMTERKRLDQLLKEKNAALETANKDLEAFAYSVSHDLRVPLRAIDGFSQQVLKRYEDKLDDEGKRYLNIVRDNTKKMSQLIDDILAFSRMGRLGLSVSEVNMEKLVHSVFEELKPALAERELTIEIKQLPLCHGDPSMLRQVLVNLLDNAIKFTRPKNAALIEMGGHTEGAENIYYIKDNGVGFDMQYADKLFGVFQRLHGVAEFEGTGIGLAIVKRIITRHGGRVWAEGKVDEGATFYFTLPD